MSSYLSSKVKKGKSKIGGDGLITIDKIAKGETVINFEGGAGRFVNKATGDSLYKKGIDYDIQVDDDLFFVASGDEIEDADFLNHSCVPNCGIKDKLKIVAMRDIDIGEEITFDYAMSESSKYSMRCECGRKKCRRIITGDDWKIPELQKKYNGFFSEYLQRKIDKITQLRKS
jgi:hypothetical protein